MVKKRPEVADAEEAGVSSKEGAVKGLLKSKGIYLIYLIREKGNGKWAAEREWGVGGGEGEEVEKGFPRHPSCDKQEQQQVASSSHGNYAR